MKHQLKENDTLANVTAEQWAVIKAIAQKQGIPIYKDNLSYTYPYKVFPHIKMHSDGDICGCRIDYSAIPFETFISKMLGIYKGPNIEVVLNNSHTAIVSKDSVKVGCQTFTHEAIERLYNASKEATN
jgi:hypothetical protein